MFAFLEEYFLIVLEKSYDMWFLKYKVRQTEIFDIFGHFLPFQSLDNLESQNFNIEKAPGDTIILHIYTINYNHIMVYDSCDMERDRQFFVILDRFLPFYPPYDPENQDFLKMKKAPEDIIILQMYHKWQSYDVWFLGIWSMTDRFFLSFWTGFCPFTLLKIRKIKILKKWNKRMEILSFYTYVPWMKIIWCMLLEILSVTDRFFVILDHFCPFIYLKTWKIKMLKNWKKCLEVLSFYTCVS